MDRRTYLIVLASAVAGCGGSKAGSTPSDAPETTATTQASTPEATGTPPDYLQSFHQRLNSRGIDIDYLGRDGVRTQLDYYVETASTAAVEKSLLKVAQAFKPPIANGWSVEGLDATVVTAGDDQTFASYRIEALWTKQYNEGTIGMGTYSGKILDTLTVSVPDPSTPSPTASPTPEPDQSTTTDFALGAVDAVPSSPDNTIHIEYNHETRQQVDVNPDDGESHSAPSGNQFLAVEVRVINKGSVPFWFYPAAIDFRETDGTEHGYRKFKNVKYPLQGQKLKAGEDVIGGIPYRINEKISEGELFFDESPYTLSVQCTFERNPNLVVTSI